MSSDNFSSSEDPIYVHCRTSAISDIRFKKRKAASTMPNSIAITKSKNNVNKKVIIKTAMSLFGAVFIMRTKVRHPLIL